MHRLPLLVLATLLTALVVAAGVVLAERPGPRPVAASTSPPEARALAVLRSWDERRAAAWATGRPAALRPLYVAGSAAGERDRRMLRRWADRGLRVTGLGVQVVSARLVESGPDRLVLVVTDRVARGRAVGPGVDVPLPADAPTTRRVTLVRVAGEWRVARVG